MTSGTDVEFVELSELSRLLKKPKNARAWKKKYEAWKLSESGRMKLREKDRKKRHRKQAQRDVIAIDGEGVTDADGSHRYTLIAASNGSEDWVRSAHELSTDDCLQFITGLPKGPLIIGFSFRYDVAMICKDIPHDALVKLWDGDVIRNHRYTLQYLPGRMLAVEDRWTEQRREIYDVFGFYQQAFVAALKEWNIECDVGEISRMKDLRGTFEDTDSDNVERYCLSECRALVLLFRRLRDACYAVDLRPNRWWGAGALAGAMLKKHKVEKFMENWKPIPVELRAYFGGRFELRQPGEYHDLHAYDIRSAYPHIIRSLPCMTHATVVGCSEYDPTVEHAIWRVDWNVGQDAIWTPFPYRYKEGIYYPWRGKGWYHASEVSAALEMFSSGVTAKEGVKLVRNCTCVPFDFVPEMYDYRAKLKANGDRAQFAIKLAINALYGKTIQAMGWKDTIPKYRNVWWAGEITAGTRAMLLRATAHDPDAVFSYATDGIVSTRPLPLTVGNGLGDWEYTPIAKGRFYQPGVYELWDADGAVKRKSRGFNPREVDWSALWEAYRDDPAYGRYSYPSTRFYGIGGSLPRADWENVFRRWITADRTLLFEPSRREPRTDGSRWYTVPPDRPSAALSEPYKRPAMPAEESDVDKLVSLEQP